MPVATQPMVGTYVADKVHSSFKFSVKHMKVANFVASFEDVDVTVISGEDGTQISGSAAAESISIKFPPEFREHVLYGADFLDAHNHPTISFASNDVTLDDAGKATINGELTIKGITRPFSAVGEFGELVEDPWGGLRTAVEFSATIDRRDWDLTWQAPLPKGGDVLAWNVDLSAHIELAKQG